MKTNLYSILATAVRLAALLHIVDTLFQVVGTFLTAEITGYSKPMGWAFVLGGLFSLAIGIVLWIKPGLLVRPAVGRSAYEVFESPLSAAQIERIGLCLLGIWFLIRGVSGAVYTLTRIATIGAEGSVGLSFSMFAPDLYYNLGTSVLGAALAFGSHGLAGLFQRLRGRDAIVSDSAHRIAAEIDAAAETAAATAPADAAATDRDSR